MSKRALRNAAMKGRRGDTQLAHVTPGEVVIPKEVAAVRPDLVAGVADTVHKMGGTPSTLKVGQGLINSQTGLQEFATAAEVTAAYTAAGRTAPTAAGLAYWMDPANNFSASTFAVSAANPQAQSQAAAIDPGYAAANPNVKASTEVADNYATLFNRTGSQIDPTGLAYWQQSGLTGDSLTNAMKASADQIAATTPKVQGTAVSNYTSNGVGFDANGQPVAAKTAATPPAPTPAPTAAPITPVVAPLAPPVTATTETAPAAVAAASTATTAPPVVAGTTAANTYTSDQAHVVNQLPPAQVTVDPNSTVAGQLKNVIATDSPLAQQAQGLATQKMNQRGLINSTMNTEAGMDALYSNALPVATADAATNANAATFNATSQNQAGALNAQLGTNVNLANAGYSNTSLQFNAQTATQTSQFNVSNALNAGIINQQQANDLAKFNANLLTTTDLSNVKDANAFQQFALTQAFNAKVINQQQYDSMSQFNASQANQFGLANLNQTFNTANMDHAAAIALNQLGAVQQNTVANMAKAQGYNLDTMTAAQVNSMATLAQQHTDALGTLSQTQTNTLATLAKQQGYNLDTMSAQQINDLAKLDKSIAGQTTLATISANASMANAATSAGASVASAQLSANASIANTATTTAAQKAIADIQAQTSTANTTASLTAQTNIAALNNAYGQMATSSASMTTLLTNYTNNVQSILTNVDLTGVGAKDAAIAQLTQYTQGALNLAGSFSGTDVTGYLVGQ